MKLATLHEYRRLVYAEGSAPALKTLRKRIKDIPGGRVELGRYYVDLDANNEANHLTKAAQSKLDRVRSDPRLKGMI
jgi:hypothetical protein